MLRTAKRFIGPPTVHRLRRKTVLDDATIRGAILMGPNARHPNTLALDGEPGPTAATWGFMMSSARRLVRQPGT
jgi:hypothetical protein